MCLQKQIIEAVTEMISKAILKNFAIFTGKHQCRSLFLIKLLKRDSNTSVSLLVLRNSSGHLQYFKEPVQMTVSKFN